MASKQPPYKVGELAQLAGVSVRTLHHYEAIGLLVPSARTASDHRLYGRDDLSRLVKITALTSLGFTLQHIGGMLDDRYSVAELVEQHLQRARELAAEQAAIVARLEQLHARLARGPDDLDTLFDTMEAMKMIESYYTKEQLEQLAKRREELGDDAIEKVQREWQELFAKIRELIDRGVPPAAPEAQAIATRANELVAMFTGGDPGIARSLNKLYAEQPVQQIHPGFDPEIFAYLGKARAAS